MNQLEHLIREGVERRVFQAAHAVVLHGGRTVFSSGSVDASARFDLASLTKVMSTTALCIALKVDPQLRVGTVLPQAGSAPATVADLLFHRSGLPAFVPFFANCATRAEAISAALRTAPVAALGVAAVYSDVGFIVLGELLSTLHQTPLEVLFTRHVAAPLGLTESSYRPRSNPPPEPTVPTGGTRPREAAPGQEGLWSMPVGPSKEGEVDDDNAWVMNGVSGHAGLFGSARDVARFGQAVLEGAVSSPLGWGVDRSTPGSTRAFGFDTPSATDASCGPRFGPRAIGHLGFTGTSLWLDFDRQLVVALLTNRVIFGRANVQIRQFRPRFHEAVLDELGL